MRKRTYIWHLVFLEENILFKESPPNIIVTRNPNWSTKILWYKICYIKGKTLSPPKCLTWGRLHCWFCLKLLKNLFSFFLFFSSFHVPNSGVNEQFLRIFLTLTLVNIAQIKKYDTPYCGVSEYFRKKWIWRRNFLCHFFYLSFIIIYTC